MGNQECKNIGEFVALMMQTEIIEAKGWFKEFLRGIPEITWQSFCKLAVTPETIENIAFGISNQISRHLKLFYYNNLGQSWQESAQNGHKFLREIHQKAVEMGLEIDQSKVDWILEPEMARSTQR
jgi:hypothetical protein